ncbi:MAG: DnaJ domain-containing protein [Cyanobacterium sp. T60_A2020_053]|nr:DnaJ domain-containing protein [Cyanobacterium sp. T60_A2020_053]
MMISELKYGLFKYEVKDYYSILGVPVSAGAKDIRLRYLKIAYQLHPDTCQADTPEGKQKASQILSKLVNPAYENLYKDKLRRECQLIFSEIGRRLAPSASSITLATDTAKTLYKEQNNREKLYQELVGKIAVEQYLDFNLITKKIALLSELNLVYLILQNETERRQEMSRSSSVGQIQSTQPIINQQTTSAQTSTQNPAPVTPPVEKKIDPTEAKLQRLLRNAQEAKELGNIDQGILELREALKLDPNSLDAHALIASLYFQQGNSTYGKIHLNKASSLDSNHPMVKKVKEEMKQATGQKAETKGKKEGKSAVKDKKVSKDKKDGKKEPPKIFGIPLW